MASSVNEMRNVYNAMHAAYVKTPTRLKIIDVYIVYGLITAFVQNPAYIEPGCYEGPAPGYKGKEPHKYHVVYMALVGSFPFNAFLSGVLSCIGTSVLGVCLRMQVNPANSKEFKDLTPERAFADFVLCNLVLHLVIMNFMG